MTTEEDQTKICEEKFVKTKSAVHMLITIICTVAAVIAASVAWGITTSSDVSSLKTSIEYQKSDVKEIKEQVGAINNKIDKLLTRRY